MGLFNFFKNITTKFHNKDIARLPEAQYINSATVEQPFIHENAYVEAYTKQLHTKPSNIINLEDGGKVIKMKQNQIDIQVKGVKKLKESLQVEDGREIDLYRGILEKDEKKNLVYFGLENGVDLSKALADKTKNYKVSNKMTKMFTVPQNKTTSKFLGSLVEDDIYKNYCIKKSPKLENYVNKIEEKRKQILQEKKKQVQNQNNKVKDKVSSKKQVKN